MGMFFGEYKTMEEDYYTEYCQVCGKEKINRKCKDDYCNSNLPNKILSNVEE